MIQFCFFPFLCTFLVKRLAEQAEELLDDAGELWDDIVVTVENGAEWLYDEASKAMRDIVDFIEESWETIFTIVATIVSIVLAIAYAPAFIVVALFLMLIGPIAEEQQSTLASNSSKSTGNKVFSTMESRIKSIDFKKTSNEYILALLTKGIKTFETIDKADSNKYKELHEAKNVLKDKNITYRMKKYLVYYVKHGRNKKRNSSVL